jgi:hypothetical protein
MFLHQVLGSTIGDTETQLSERATADAMGEGVMDVEKDSAAYQLVQHLSHFLLISVISLFLSQVFFIKFLPQFFGSSAGKVATQSCVQADNFMSVIHDVIRGLEDDPT